MNHIPDRFSMSVRGWIAHTAAGAGLALGAVVLLNLTGCASAPAGPPPERLGFPSPASGPGRPDLDKGAKEQISEGWQSLLRGDTAAARSGAARVAGTAGRLLEMQADVVEGSDAVADLEQLTGSMPDYAAAWLTLSVAAENSDNEKLALTAARRGAELWSDQRWVDREQALHQRWIGDRIASARTLYEADNPEKARSALLPALEIEPDNRDAVILEARIFIDLDQPDRAESVLAKLPRDPEVIRVSGNIAEARGDLNAAMRIYSSLQDDPEALLMAIDIAETQSDWLTAMNLYSALPDDQPEKGPGLRRSQLRWRISVMPGYVQEAMVSPELNRADLAVILVTLAPKVETLPGGQVPLLSDVMNLPSQDEILTAARFGLVDSDRLEHRFHPARLVTAAEVRSSITTLGRLLEVESPVFCTDEAENPCTPLNPPLSGQKVSGIVIDMVAREAQ
jgi:tetratricopeptide (TPR) repeat protein